MKVRLVHKGGPGSGHFGHRGRPGKHGGSLPGGGGGGGGGKAHPRDAGKHYPPISEAAKKKFRRILPGGKGRKRGYEWKKKPDGSNDYDSEPTEFLRDEWSVSGGHAGNNAILTAQNKALKMGFERVDHTSSHLPDGSWVQSSDYFLHKATGVVLETTNHYGTVAYDNWFHAQLHFPKGEAE